MSVFDLSRRGFLAAGAGLVLGLHLPGLARPARAATGEGAGAFDLGAWVRIAPDDTVTLRIASAEMGQGVYSSLSLILAEELDASWSQVRVEAAPVGKAYRRSAIEMPGRVQMTGGSTSVRGYYDVLREAGATARAMLVAAAANRWGCAPEECTVSEGVVSWGEQSATFGDLAEAAAAVGHPGKVRLKDPAEFTLVRSDAPRLDIPAKTDGTATFGIDVQREGMVVAVPRACPHFGGSLVSFDASAARAMPGVVDVLRVGDAVVVVADTYWRAKKAVAAVEVIWDPGPHGDLDSEAIRAMNLAGLDRKSSKGAVTLEATYEAPYLEHAHLEPLNCTIHVQPDRADVWVGTQVPARVQSLVARATGLPRRAVHVHTPFLGGGFGRRGNTLHVEQAAEVARRFDVPVKLLWSREEQFAHGYYRPSVACRMRATVEEGTPTRWEIVLAGQNVVDRYVPDFLGDLRIARSVLHDGLSNHPYAVPGVCRVADVNLPVPVGFWRSVHGSHNGFFRECFVDEMAEAAGQDPVAFRRALLAGHPRERAVFDRAVQEAGAVPEGQHRGVAMFECFGSLCAQVADVSVADGFVKVHRVTAAIDCGSVVHPDTVRAQITGGIAMGLSAALGEEVRIANAAAVPTNFHQYPVLKLARMPQVDVHIVESGEKLGGIGELGVPPIAAAVCNGIYAATGKRIRRLPIADQLAT